MVVGPDYTRAPKESEWEEIDDLLTQAFGQPDEANLVKQLRENGDIWMEFVKPWNGVIGGYAALSRMQKPKGWTCLAPVAVRPEFQNGTLAPDETQRRYYSFGTRLISEIAEMVRLSSTKLAEGRDWPTTIVVVGKPSFYERAGFSSKRANKLTSPYPVDVTLIARDGDDVPEETIVYPGAFEELD